jgi:hypothetical protein
MSALPDSAQPAVLRRQADLGLSLPPSKRVEEQTTRSVAYKHSKQAVEKWVRARVCCIQCLLCLPQHTKRPLTTATHRQSQSRGRAHHLPAAQRHRQGAVCPSQNIASAPLLSCFLGAQFPLIMFASSFPRRGPHLTTTFVGISQPARAVHGRPRPLLCAHDRTREGDFCHLVCEHGCRATRPDAYKRRRACPCRFVPHSRIAS